MVVSRNLDSKTQSTMIGKDIPWGETKGHGFRVKKFTSLASIGQDEIKEPKQSLHSTPYALFEVECPFFDYGETTILLPVVHRLDFRHCWELFNERGIEPEEEVIVSYSPSESKFYKFFGKSLPHLLIEVRPKGSLEEIYELGKYDGLGVLEVLHRTKPIVVWEPFEGRME
ncbi:MAG: hypothetical protein ABIK32_01270 [Chloroflexota bacterium]|nr:hypothetical protein [Chloroflexota bacterium]